MKVYVHLRNIPHTYFRQVEITTIGPRGARLEIGCDAHLNKVYTMYDVSRDSFNFSGCPMDLIALLMGCRIAKPALASFRTSLLPKN